MSRLRQDVTHAIRTFAKAPGFTAIAVLVLAIGIGANTATFSIANELLLRPLSGRASELVGVYSHDRTQPGSYRLFSYPNYLDVRDRTDVFDALMAHTFTMVGTPAGDGQRRMLAAVVSSNYFDTLGVRLAAGRTFSQEEERPAARIPVAIVSYARWKREQLDPSFVGRTIEINSDQFTVVGVTPERFSGTMALVSAEVYLPVGMFDSVVNDRFKNNGRGAGDRGNGGFVVAGRLTTGLTDALVSARLAAVSRQLEADHPADNANQVLTLNPLSRMSASPAPQNNTGLTAFTALLMALSGVVLVIACLNIANMLLARGTARRKELALRLALGAGRARVVRQLLTESVLLSAVGSAFGLLLSYWATRTLATSITSALPFSVNLTPTPDGAVLLATLVFAVLGTIAFGLGPALTLSRRDLVTDLKDRANEASSSGRRFGPRNLMVIGQVALSLALLTAGGIFARTAWDAAAGHPGYSYDRLIVASLDVTLAGFDEPRGTVAYGDTLARVRAMPGVTAATMASTIPFGDSQDGRRFERVGASGQEPVAARAYRVIGADYFTTLDLRLIRGREFTLGEEMSATSPRVAIVDEMFARQLFGDVDPIGQMIRLAPDEGTPGSVAGPPMEIVGIAPPIREELLDRGPVPHVYVPFGRHYRATMHVHMKLAPGSNERAAMDAMRAEIRRVDARIPVLALSTMRAFHDGSVELWGLRTGARAFAGLGLLALLLAAIGVYGVKSYTVARRTREIGIRMALGASARDVMRLILGDGLLLTGIGLTIGLPLAVLVSIAFQSVFVEIGGIDVAVLVVATLVLASAATLASALPARRAMKVQPLIALQTD